MHSMRFWIKAFIPDSVCGLFGDTVRVQAPNGAIFSGDQREFSRDANASAPAHSEVMFGDLELRDSATLREQLHPCGESHELDNEGNILRTATAATDRMLFQNLRGSETVDPEGGIVDGIHGSLQQVAGAAHEMKLMTPIEAKYWKLAFQRAGRPSVGAQPVSDRPALRHLRMREQRRGCRQSLAAEGDR